MGILKDVDIAVKDGGLGRVAAGADVLGVVGVGSVTQKGVVSISSFDEVKTKVGDGPLRDFLEGVFSQVAVPCYARVLPGSTAGTITAVTAKAGNKGVGTLAAAGKPANAYTVSVAVVNSGGLNAATFRVTRNGLKGKEVTVPANGTYLVPDTGITLTFSAGNPAGTNVSFSKGDSFTFSSAAPSATNGELLAGVDALTDKAVAYRHIAVAGVTASAFWASFAAKLDKLTDSHRWLWGSAGVRARKSGDTTDAYVDDLTGSERGSVVSKRLMVCAAWVEQADIEGYKGDRNAHGKLIGRIFGVGVAVSPGWTRLGPLTGVESLLYEVTPTQIKALEDAGYATLRYYDGKKGVYVSDSHLMTEETSDFDTSVKIEVMNKACRLVREAQFPYLKQGFDVLSDGRVPELSQVQAAGEQALDTMRREGEISSGRIELDEKQNILSTKKVTEKIAIVPRGQVDEISATIQFENPANTKDGE